MDKFGVAMFIFGILAVVAIATQPVQLAQQNQTINYKLTSFTEKWEKRIRISNNINNDTQLKIESAVTNVLGNLTAHRHVTNATFDKVQENQRVLIEFIKKFNNTNEVERGKAVDKILSSIQDIKSILSQNKTS